MRLVNRLSIGLLLTAAAAFAQYPIPGASGGGGGGGGCVAGTGITCVGSTISVDTAVIESRATAQSGASTYCRSTTGNDTYTCALTPTLTAYTTGSCLVLNADTANTGAATINVDALGAKSILNRAGSALSNGDITADKPITICYDGTSLIIQGDGSSGSSLAPIYTTTSYSATPTFTVSASSIQGFFITLTGNVTSSTLSTGSATTGQDIWFNICQDGTGPHTFVPPSNVIGMGTIAATANACSRQVFRWDGTNAIAITSMTCPACSGSIYLPGSTSGGSTIQAPATSGGTNTLPSGAGTLARTIDTVSAANALATPRAIYGNNFDGSAALTQIVASTYGGTGNGFTKFAGPTTAEKTFTLPDASATLTQTIASGTSALGTSSISANACATVVTTAATGTASTDAIIATPNADISGVTGYGSGSSDGLIIYPYPTSNNVNFKVCNGTGSSITPGAVTLNWRVVR